MKIVSPVYYLCFLNEIKYRWLLLATSLGITHLYIEFKRESDCYPIALFKRCIIAVIEYLPLTLPLEGHKHPMSADRLTLRQPFNDLTNLIVHK